MDDANGSGLLSVVLPVYNEVENLPALVKELREALEGWSYEIIFVDDGSKDGSPDFLKQLALEDARIKVVLFRRNFGQTAALQAGFDHAKGGIIASLDSDLQNPPSEIIKLLQNMEPGVDMVAGYRLNRQDEQKRVLISKIANFFIRKITGVAIRDNGCTLKVMRSWCVKEFRLYGEMHRFIAAHVHRMGGVIKEVGVLHRPRHAGTSKYGWSRIVKVVLDLLTVSYFQGYANKPAYFFGGLGLGMGGFSTLLFAVVLYQKWFLGAWVHKNPLFLLGAFVGLVGIQFISIGILAEVLMRTHHEATETKIYRVREKFNLPD